MGGLRAALARLLGKGGPRTKEEHELSYWQRRLAIEGTLANGHYREFHTDHFGFAPGDFAGKRVLDIGCGPRGSLEWADMAAERVGLDPLAAEYLRIGADKHRMRYVAAPSEKMPFADAHFDFVFSFNSLDHVEDVDATIAEIKRVVRPGGYFLLLTDVNHDPTPYEPQSFGWDIRDRFLPEFELAKVGEYERLRDQGIYDSLRPGAPYDHGNPEKRYGILSAKFRRR